MHPATPMAICPGVYVKRMFQQLGKVWVQIHQGQYVGLIRHRGRKMVALAVLLPKAH